MIDPDSPEAAYRHAERLDTYGDLLANPDPSPTGLRSIWARVEANAGPPVSIDRELTGAELRPIFEDLTYRGMPADDVFEGLVAAYLSQGGQLSGNFGRWQTWAVLFAAEGLQVGPRLVLLSLGMGYDFGDSAPSVQDLAIASSQTTDAVRRQLADLAAAGLVRWTDGRLTLAVPEGLTPGLVDWSA